MFSRSIPHAHNLKCIQFCASCVVRNIYTSDICFRSHGDLPREMKFSQKENANANELLKGWVNIPKIPEGRNAMNWGAHIYLLFGILFFGMLFFGILFLGCFFLGCFFWDIHFTTFQHALYLRFNRTKI